VKFHDEKNLPPGFVLSHDSWAQHPRSYELRKDGVLVALIRERHGTDAESVRSMSPEHRSMIEEIWFAKKAADRCDRERDLNIWHQESAKRNASLASAAAAALGPISAIKENAKCKS